MISKQERVIAARIRESLTPITRPADVARMLGISKEMVNHITNKALLKIVIGMRGRV